MKKIIFIFLSFFILNTTFALDFYSDNSTRFYFNEIKTIWNITVKQTSDAEITKDKWINILIWESDKIRFNNYSLSWIVISWIAKDKIESYSFDNTLTKFSIKLKEDFKKDDTITISWIQAISYDREQWNRTMWIDINWDFIWDFFDINWIKVETWNDKTDTHSPNEVFNLTWSLNNSWIILSLSWLNPWDLDLNWVKLESLDSDKKLIKEDFVYATWYTLNLDNQTKSVFSKNFW